jgi:hypothetical protein
LKEPSDVENDYKHFIALVQEAAKMATPTSHHNNTRNDIPLRIKKAIAEKRIAKHSLPGRQIKIQPTQQHTKASTTILKKRIL